jgi:hypothetical protein
MRSVLKRTSATRNSGEETAARIKPKRFAGLLISITASVTAWLKGGEKYEKYFSSMQKLCANS